MNTFRCKSMFSTASAATRSCFQLQPERLQQYIIRATSYCVYQIIYNLLIASMILTIIITEFVRHIPATGGLEEDIVRAMYGMKV